MIVPPETRYLWIRAAQTQSGVPDHFRLWRGRFRAISEIKVGQYPSPRALDVSFYLVQFLEQDYTGDLLDWETSPKADQRESSPKHGR